MRITNLNAEWVGYGGDGVTYSATGLPVPRRERVGVHMDCPCGTCGQALFVSFSNPDDGLGPTSTNPNHPTWERAGETLETLTLRPSIQRIGGCEWHGFITNGEAHAC